MGVADRENLSSHSCQTAFVTAALVMARSGHAIHLHAPEVALAGPQPPLPDPHLLAGLLAVGRDLVPGVELQAGPPSTQVDLAIVFGNSAWAGTATTTLWIHADAWGCEISSAPATAWPDEEWPIGAIAAGTLAAAEAFKVAMRRLAAYAQHEAFFSRLFSPISHAYHRLAPEGTPTTTQLGTFDCISGGAVTQAALFALARLPGVQGRARVIEPEQSDLPNINRYMLLKRSRLDTYKADDIASQDLGGLSIEPINCRFEPGMLDRIGHLSMAVLVGVDHIPSRWVAQKLAPGWMGVGATSNFQTLVSFHRPDDACAGCLHPDDAPDAGTLATVAFVSCLAGLRLAALFARHAGGEAIDLDEQQVTSFPLRPENIIASPVWAHPACPVACRASEHAHRETAAE